MTSGHCTFIFGTSAPAPPVPLRSFLAALSEKNPLKRYDTSKYVNSYCDTYLRSIVICYLFPRIKNSKIAGSFGFSWQTNVPENLPPGMPHQDAGKVCCQQRENVTRAPRCYHRGSCEMTGKLYVQLALSFFEEG